MFSIPGVLGLIFLTYVRPQAFVTELQGLPLVHLVYLLAAVGFAIDVRTRLITPRTSPLLPYTVAYFAWAIITLALARPDALTANAPGIFILLALYFMTSQSVQSLRATKTAVLTLVLVSVFLSIVGIHQGLAPHGCFGQRVGPTAIYDGRSCDHPSDCARDGEPGTHYHCERIGLFGTYTINDRVRWLGIIEDPNELAMCVSLCVPLLIGLYQLRPSRWRGLLVLLAAGGFVLCTVYTQSRGGQLVFLTAIGVYFIRRYGMRGVLVCALVALPVLLFGGREGTDAEESKMERLEALLTASDLLFQRPIFGVGFYQFTEYHVRTAHNSYALSAAELGFPGLCLFVAVLYQSMKSFITIARRCERNGPARAAYIWAGALAAAQCGLMVGIFFLSFNASPILWTFFGITSGFQLAVKRHDPSLDLTLKLRDAAAITGISLALAVFMYSYSHWKVGGH